MTVAVLRSDIEDTLCMSSSQKFPFPCFLTEKLYAYYVPLLRWVHTCNITVYCNAVMLQVTDTIRSCELNFHPVPHGVTVSCECYTMGFLVCYGSSSDVFATSRGFIHLSVYILCFKEKEKRVVVVAKANLDKQGSVQQFKFTCRLEFSFGQWVI